MKNITQFINNNNILEAKTMSSSVIPVMYSIHGNINGPWYFGYTDKTIKVGKMKVFGVAEDSSNVNYANLVVPFNDFDPINMDNNEANNINVK